MTTRPDTALHTLYSLLGVGPDTSFESARRAFRFATVANHPDRNADDPFAAKRFRAIYEGWQLVGTPEKWAAHQISATSGGLRNGSPAAAKPARATRVIGALRIEREHVKKDGTGKWRVLVDGKRVGRLGLGEHVEAVLEPGVHRLQVAGSVDRSRPMTLEIAADQRLVVRCRLDSYWKAYFEPWRAVRLARVV